MIRNLKTLGLSVVALLAMTAVAASAASAAEFHSESEPAIFEGPQVTAIEIGVTTFPPIKCTSATYKGTQSTKTSTTATVHPTYSNCKAFGVNATVTTTGCDFLFHVGSGTTTDIVCSGSSRITITPTGIECVITVGNQVGLTGITLTNSGSGATRAISAAANVKSLEFTETGAGCAEPGYMLGGSYTGTVAMRGYVDNAGTKGAQQGIWVE